MFVFNTEQNKSSYLRDAGNDFHPLFATTKAQIYCLGTFRAPVAAQVMVKVQRKIHKSLMFENIRLSY